MIMADVVQLEIKQVDMLVDTQSCVNFFERQILHQLGYWGRHEAIKKNEFNILDRRRESILNVITFGLELKEAWPLVYDLILAFTRYMERRGHWQVWNTLLSRAIELANQVGDTAGAMTLSVLLARLYNRQSRPEETIYYYRQAIHLARQGGNQYEEARACSNLGYLYVTRGQWWRAEVLCCHALIIFEALKSEHGQAHTHNHLGVLYTRRRIWGQAEDHLQRACILWKSMNDLHGLIYGFENLGLLFNEMRQPDVALIHLEKALEQARNTGEESELGTIWMNMGITYRQNGDLKQAKAYIKQAEAIFYKFSNSLGLAQVWDNLGMVYFRQRKWTEADHYLKTSLEKYRALKNWDGEIKVLLNIIEYELEQENQAQVAIQLDEIEVLVRHYTQSGQQDYLNQRLEEYRGRLLEKPGKPLVL